MKLKPTYKEYINDQGKPIKYLDKNRTLDFEIASQWKQHLEKIDKKDLQFSCSVSVRRVFYNVTSMPSELRRFLRYEGRELYYLDYSNFQPFLFNKILKEQFGVDMPTDVLSYIQLTCEGRFYAEVKKQVEAAGIEIKNPDSFKIDFFARVFFSSETRKYKYRLVFQKHFPNVSACITKIKGKDFKQLAIKLQRLEAEIVINTILQEIAEQQPDAFVLPVHDALICELKYTDYIQKLMLEKARLVIGYTPKIKHELLTMNYEKAI